MSEKENIIPVLLGADLNAYSVALSFRIAYGVKSILLARERLSIVSTSDFVTIRCIEGLDDCNTATDALVCLAKEFSGSRLFLVPCSDWYMEAVEYSRDILSEYYELFIPPFESWQVLDGKLSFYRLLDMLNIPYPKTEVYKRGEKIGIKPPIVIKPSDSTEYWKNPFDGAKKVYFAKSEGEAVSICEKIEKSGYTDKIILQEYIAAQRASVLTVFSDGHRQAVRAVLADVVLEENAPKARGNYSALITRPLDAISKKLINLLDRIGYTSFANFDILYRDGRPFVLEANPRQGRSCDYLRAAGVSVAELLVKAGGGEKIRPDFDYPEVLWHSSPGLLIGKYGKCEELSERARALIKEKKSISPFFISYDSRPRRRIYSLIHALRQIRSFRKYGEKRNAPV